MAHGGSMYNGGRELKVNFDNNGMSKSKRW